MKTSLDIKTRNKDVKRLLTSVLPDCKISVTNGKGTSYGWCYINILADDPCPARQHSDTCSNYCKDGICLGNNKIIGGGWGNSARQEAHEKIQRIVDEAIKNCQFYSYTDDMGGTNKEYLVHVRWVEPEKKE